MPKWNGSDAHRPTNKWVFSALLKFVRDEQSGDDFTKRFSYQQFEMIRGRIYGAVAFKQKEGYRTH